MVARNVGLHPAYRNRLREAQPAAVIQRHAAVGITDKLQRSVVAHQEPRIGLHVDSVILAALRCKCARAGISGEIRVVEDRHARLALQVHAVPAVIADVHLRNLRPCPVPLSS